jgi:alpha-glutamyl/putrescinyl thymine pyrophosphorylase clade 1
VAGQRRPWTSDPILHEWSFCNVRRECDRVTIWVADNWRTPHADDPDLWFAMAVARLTNWPDTMEAIGYPVPRSRERFVAALRAREARGDKVWGRAYTIIPKIDRIAGMLDACWQRRDKLRPRPGDTLQSFYDRLRAMRGFGSFYVGQIIADLKYAQLKDARDWLTFAAPGPGSERGLNRVLGRPVKASWTENLWCTELRKLHDMIRPALERLGLGDLHAQDLQNCLCELDKMERTRLGEGTPKRRYVERAV